MFFPLDNKRPEMYTHPFILFVNNPMWTRKYVNFLTELLRFLILEFWFLSFGEECHTQM